MLPSYLFVDANVEEDRSDAEAGWVVGLLGVGGGQEAVHVFWYGQHHPQPTPVDAAGRKITKSTTNTATHFLITSLKIHVHSKAQTD